MPDKVESIWDIERQVKDGERLLTLLADVKAQILATPKIMLDYKGADGITSAKEAAQALTLANKQLTLSQKELNLEITKRKEEERALTTDNRRQSQERIMAIRLEAAELRAQQLEIKKQKIADAEKAAQEKINRQESLQAGREKILQMRAEVEAAEKLLEEQKRLNQQEAINYDLNLKRGQLVGKTGTAPEAAFVPKGEMQELINQRIKYQNAIQAAQATQKEDFRLMEAGSISQREYRKRLVESSVAIEQNKVKVSNLNKEIKSLIPTEAAADAELAKQEKIARELSSDYTQLQLAYKAAAQRAKEFSSSLGIQHPLAIQAQKDAQALGTQLNNIDKAAKPATASTGNFLNQAWGGIRKIAYLLPGVGIAGLLAFATEPIVAFVANIFKAKDSLDSLAKSQELLTTAMEDSNYQDAVKNVAELTTNIALAKQGFLDKEKVLHQYNRTIGETTGEVKTLDEAETALAKNADAYIKMMLYKAAATLSLNEAAKKAVEAQKEFQKQEQIAADLVKPGEADKDKNLGADGVSDFLSRGVKGSANKAKATADKEITTLEGIAKKFQTDAAKIAKDFGFDFFGGKEDEKTKKARSSRESTKTILDSNFEEYKIDQKRKIKLLEEGVNDERKTYDERIDLLQKFSTESIVLAKAQGVEDLRILNDKLAAQESNLKKAKGTERNNLLIEIANTKTAISLANKKENDEELNIRDAHNKKFLELEKQHNDLLKKAKEQLYKDLQDYAKQYGTDVQFKLEAEQFERIKQLDADFAAGKIKSIKQYKDQKEAIENEYNRKEISTDITVQNLLLELADTNGKSEVDIQRKILELKKRLYELDTKNLLTEAEKQAAITLDKANARKKVEDEVEKTFTSIFTAKFTREKNELEQQKVALDELTASKIDSVNKELISEEAKAAKITSIQLTAAAKRKEMDNKQKEIDYKKAIFDKGLAIADVVKDTARAVAADLKDKKYLIPFDIAIGAAQVAAILATPVPRFEDGTESAPKGWALTDEAGPEMYIKPDGSVEIGNDKPTLRYLEAGTKIIPHDEMNRLMMNSMMQRTANLIMRDDKKIDEVKQAVMWGAQETIKALKKNSKKTYVNVHVDSGFNAYIRKNVFE